MRFAIIASFRGEAVHRGSVRRRTSNVCGVVENFFLSLFLSSGSEVKRSAVFRWAAAVVKGGVVRSAQLRKKPETETLNLINPA